MVERIYKGVVTSVEEHDVISKEQKEIMNVKRCSCCKGPFDKGMEIVVMGAMKGYKGTFCSSECRRLGVKDDG